MIWMNENIPLKYTLENTEGTIKNGQYRETSIIDRTRRRKTNKNTTNIFIQNEF
jgi:hypothetical protein